VKKRAARREDFMDEKDIAEINERSSLPLAFQKENSAAFDSIFATSGATIG
jgi:hypothetical protein